MNGDGSPGRRARDEGGPTARSRAVGGDGRGPASRDDARANRWVPGLVALGEGERLALPYGRKTWRAGREKGSAGSTVSQVNWVIGERRWGIVALVILSIVGGLIEAGTLACIAQIGVALLKHQHAVHYKVDGLRLHLTVAELFAISVGMLLARLALQFPSATLTSRISTEVQASMRQQLFGAYTRASWEMQSQDREGHVQETMTGQALQATGASMSATGLVGSLFTFLVLVGMSLALNPLIAVVVMVGTLGAVVLLRPLRLLAVRRARALSQAQVGYAGGLAEAIRLAQETHVFGVAGAVRRRNDELIAIAAELFFRNSRLGRLIGGIYQCVIYAMLVGGLYLLYVTGQAHPVTVGAIVLLGMRAGNYGQQVQSQWQGLRTAVPFIERLQESKMRYLDSVLPEGDELLPEVQTLAFEHVGYSYVPGRPVLTDVTFEVERGEAIGIIGPSGAGKSTLIQVLLRLRPPKEGRYLVNGLPVEQYRAADWHREIAYVPQEPRLLHASVAENIRYFRELDDETVEWAGRLAGVHDEIMGWSDGYETIVGPRADAVSGGQQQRICLARALATRPGMLVLDEPTSALDPHSERVIQESLEALRDELTLFIIAHRMSTLDICGRVMVILDGRLAAFDTVAVLREQSDYYRTATALAASSPVGQLL